MNLVKSLKYQKAAAILCGTLIFNLKNKFQTQAFAQKSIWQERKLWTKYSSWFCRQSGEGMKVCRVRKATSIVKKFWKSSVPEELMPVQCTYVNNVLLELACLQSTTCPFLHWFSLSEMTSVLWLPTKLIGYSQLLAFLHLYKFDAVIIWGIEAEGGHAPADQREAGCALQAVRIAPGEGQVRAVTTGVTLAQHSEPPDSNAEHYSSLKF